MSTVLASLKEPIVGPLQKSTHITERVSQQTLYTKSASSSNHVPEVFVVVSMQTITAVKTLTKVL